MAPELALVDAGAGPEAALTWLEPLEPDGGHHADAAGWRLRFARLGRDGWSEASTIAGGDAGDTDQSSALFANWADRPGAVQGAPSATPKGRVAPIFAYWLAKNGKSTYAYVIEVARSDDGGQSWRGLGRLHADASAVEHGFVSAVPEADGVRAFWLDGGRTVDGHPTTLRTARVGETVDRSSEELLDDSVCDCCNTAAVLAAGGPLVVYRDRSGDEIRDTWLVRRDASGSWSAPKPLHRDGWTIPACPVNGPAIGRLGDTVWVVWYTAEGSRPRVLASVSRDGGATFGAPVTVDAPSEGGAPLGRLDLAVDRSGSQGQGDAILSWLDTDEGGAVIRLRRLGADGRLGPPVTAVRTSDTRASGVPRLLALPRGSVTRLVLTWVDPGHGIRLVSLPAAAVPAASPADSSGASPAV